MECQWCNIGYPKIGDTHLSPHDPRNDKPQEKPVFQCQMENKECQNENKSSN